MLENQAITSSGNLNRLRVRLRLLWIPPELWRLILLLLNRHGTPLQGERLKDSQVMDSEGSKESEPAANAGNIQQPNVEDQQGNNSEFVAVSRGKSVKGQPKTVESTSKAMGDHGPGKGKGREDISIGNRFTVLEPASDGGDGSDDSAKDGEYMRDDMCQDIPSTSGTVCTVNTEVDIELGRVLPDSIVNPAPNTETVAVNLSEYKKSVIMGYINGTGAVPALVANAWSSEEWVYFQNQCYLGYINGWRCCCAIWKMLYFGDLYKELGGTGPMVCSYTIISGKGVDHDLSRMGGPVGSGFGSTYHSFLMCFHSSNGGWFWGYNRENALWSWLLSSWFSYNRSCHSCMVGFWDRKGLLRVGNWWVPAVNNGRLLEIWAGDMLFGWSCWVDIHMSTSCILGLVLNFGYSPLLDPCAGVHVDPIGLASSPVMASRLSKKRTMLPLCITLYSNEHLSKETIKKLQIDEDS
ncbi:hypothetical protein E3N88_06150 [Mikania micrantha]|uniref:Uncharacterized protein n=1 Tax=Mikania micrantha TaxID=192012 RepID=A0A5N6PMX6_9ASTR|nr:hypothetical protein E3N88_06150 [Mikania micrantha]